MFSNEQCSFTKSEGAEVIRSAPIEYPLESLHEHSVFERNQLEVVRLHVSGDGPTIAYTSNSFLDSARPGMEWEFCERARR